jgi:hypothetical protein
MIRKKYAQILQMAGVLILIGSVLLSAADIDSSIDAALKNSMSGRLNDLQRTISTLQWERSDLEQSEEKGLSFSTGEGTLSYVKDLTGDHVVSLEPSATVTFHDLDLTITLTAPTTLNATDSVVSSTPKVSIQKKLETYNPEENTTLEDFESAAVKMDIDRNYYAGLIAIEKSVLQSVKELVSLDKSILITEKSISDAELSLDNDLKSGLLKAGSTTWKLRTNSIIRLKNTLSAVQNDISAARDNFEHITGTTYEDITSEEIPKPDITFKAPEMGNTIVLSAALDVEIAKQKLTDEISTKESNEISDSSFTYLLSGSYKAGLNQPVGNYDHTLQAGVTASNSEFVFEAGVITVIDAATITPSAYITGRWTDQPVDWKEFDELTVKILENQAVSSEQSYNQTFSNYLYDIQDMQLRISSWNISSIELDLAYSENILQLEDAVYAHSKGFGTASDVQDAQYKLQITEYEQMLQALEGLLLERDMRTLQL